MISHPAAGWHIRAFQDDDKALCADVFAECVAHFNWLRDGQAAPQHWVDERAKISTWVAEVDQAGVVGLLMLSGRSAYVNYLLVRMDWRLCGVGQALLDTARDHAGVGLCLDVDADNTFARRAYEAMGFQVDRITKQGNRTLVRMIGN